MSKGVKVTLWVIGGLVVAFALIQLVPYGRDHTNPPVTSEAHVGQSADAELAKRACFDCHSNETVWPWYSNVAPVSWLVQRDVDEGARQPELLGVAAAAGRRRRGDRRRDRRGRSTEARCRRSSTSSCTRDARLSDAEKQELIAGLEASLK